MKHIALILFFAALFPTFWTMQEMNPREYAGIIKGWGVFGLFMFPLFWALWAIVLGAPLMVFAIICDMFRK